MKRSFKYIILASFIGAMATGCSNNDDEKLVPAEVTNLRAESTPGRIVLRWETPEEGNIRYIQVNYYDPLLKKDVMKTASSYADSMEIADTRRKYGEYTFNVKSVSPTGGISAMQEIKTLSEPAEATWVSTPIVLKAEDLATNAQEPSEGAIANLVDGNNSTYFHSTWSGNVPPAPHWFSANLNQTLDGHFKFTIVARNNNNRPSDVDLMGSTDGEQWFLIRHLDKENDGLSLTSPYESETFAIEQPFSHIKFVVNATNTGSIFFSMAEFKLYNMELIDPEAPDEE